MAVKAPDNAFMATNLVQIPDLAVLDSAFEDPDTKFVGPYSDTDAGTTVVTTRYLMYLLPKFLPLAFSQPSFSPFQTWEILGNTICRYALLDNAATSINQYAPILTWLRTACTCFQNADNEEDLANALCKMEIPKPRFPMMPEITAATQQIICCNLPGLTPESAPTATDSTVHAINQLTNQIQEGQDCKEAHQRAPKTKTPSSTFARAKISSSLGCLL